MFNLITCNFNSVTKIYKFFFQQPLLKVDFLKWLPLSWLLNLAPSPIILVWRKILKLACAVLWTDTKNSWILCKSWQIGLEYSCFKQQHEYKLASSPPYTCMYSKKLWFLHSEKEFIECFWSLQISNHFLCDKWNSTKKEKFKILSNAALKLFHHLCFSTCITHANLDLPTLQCDRCGRVLSGKVGSGYVLMCNPDG